MINRETTVYNGKSHAIFVPGDNDIGGEGSDRVTKDKVKRFNKNFPSQPVYTFRKKSLLEVFLMPGEMKLKGTLMKWFQKE